MFVSAKETVNDKDRVDSAVADAKDHVKDGVHRIKKDAQDTVGKVKDDLSSAASVMRNAGAQARDFVNSASHGISNASDNVASQIRHNPLPAAFLAVGLGVVIGALFSRR